MYKNTQNWYLSGTYYVNWELPTDVVYDQILPIFFQNSLASQVEDITSARKSNRHNISSAITKFLDFEFLLFSVFSKLVMSGNRCRIWYITLDL